jgi:pimeloyl-ACP methyl ester carboxylesterase
MHTKRFQVTSESFRLQAVLDLPEEGEMWPLVVVNHAGGSPKDGALFGGLPQLLTKEGIAVCRFDPRGYGESEGAGQPVTFWTRWVDMTAIVQHLSRDERFLKTGFIGAGMGATVTLWWSALHSASAAVGLSLPAPKALGALPRAIENLIPLDLKGAVPHPQNVPNSLLIYGDKDKEAVTALETARHIGAGVEIIPGSDKSFSQVKARAEAMRISADWFRRFLVLGETVAPAHDASESELASEPGPQEAAGAADPDFLPPE